MKEIKAIIQPFMKDRVLEALRQLEGLPGVTVSEVMGYGKRYSDTDDPDADAGPIFLPKAKLEIVVPDKLVELVVGTVARAAHTGRRGDGHVFVSDVVSAVKIRTGERDSDAV